MSIITADQIADIIPTLYKSGITGMFVGKPGIGKTDFIREGARQLSAEFGEPVLVRELHLSSMTETDVRGYLVPVTEQAPAIPGVPPLPGARPITRAVFTQPEFWAAVDASPRGILFLDEFAQASHEVQKAVAPLLLEGRIGEYVLPEGWVVMIASNSVDDDTGANSVLPHVLNRVCRIEVKSPDVQMWETWAMGNGVPFELVVFAKLRPGVVFDAPLPTVPDEPYCTPRSLARLGRVANAYPGGLREMINTTHGLSMVHGMIGAGAAVELSAVISMAINLPSYEQVISDPDRTVIPAEADRQYAMMAMVTTRASLDDCDAAVRYLTRFDANYAMTAIVSLVRRNPKFLSNQVASAWIMANRNLLQKFSKWITGAVK